VGGFCLGELDKTELIWDSFMENTEQDTCLSSGNSYCQSTCLWIWKWRDM